MKEKKIKKRKCKNCRGEFVPERQMITPLCGYECALDYNRKIEEKRRKEKEKKLFKDMKINAYSKDYQKELQDEINKLSRMIDRKYGFITCIDCNKHFTGQIDAAHFHSRGAHNSIKYNLHNLHSANGYCNQYDQNHKTGYTQGLINRYGIMYYNKVESLISKYKYIKLTEKEVYEKLKLVRKLIREFDDLELTDSEMERERYNQLIGIYL